MGTCTSIADVTKGSPFPWALLSAAPAASSPARQQEVLWTAPPDKPEFYPLVVTNSLQWKPWLDLPIDGGSFHFANCDR
jgi:hypothetical protein